MTARKYHWWHCPTCKFYLGMIRCGQKPGIVLDLKDVTTIKCKYYQKER